MNASNLIVAGLAFSMSVSAFAAGTHGGGHGHGASIGEPGKASEASRTITVEMHDNYYEPEEIRVKPGETVRFVVQNKGNLVHEFNIGTPGMHEAHQKEMRMMVEHGVIQGNKLNHDMMNMDMVWTFANQGNIEFACNVPGHYQSGMYGDVNFE